MDVLAAADEWARLRTSDLPSEQHVAAWMDMPSDAWAAVLLRHPELAEWVAHAKKAPPDIIARLASHPDPRVRSNVAGQRRLDPALRQELANDPDELVRTAAARFSNTDG